MDVPFISSGAINRAHYVLVRKVEESPSEGATNRILEAEVKAIRGQLSQPGLSNKKIMEALITLLYCSMSTIGSIFPQGTFDFALPHALSLAEAGTTLEHKRIGYLFCSEMMTLDNEMRLLLVNTLRKDLEDDQISVICLGLNNMITSSSADVIPAVQQRLHDLLSHNHSSVRRRALYALHNLSQHEPNLLRETQTKVLRRMRDRDQSVAIAAFRVSETLAKNVALDDQLAPAIQDAVNDAFEEYVQAYTPTWRGPILASLKVVEIVGLRTLSLPSAFDLLKASAENQDKVVLLALYKLFKPFDTATLRAVEEQTEMSIVGSIRDYLTSSDPNDLSLFLSCLESVDPILWSGTSDDIPAVLEAWEVERIMNLLGSNDILIRKKTLRLLKQVDQNLLTMYYGQAIAATTNATPSLKELNERSKRLLEVIEVLSGDNGEVYAGQVKDLLSQIEGVEHVNGLLDSVIEGVLGYIRTMETSFRVGFAATLLTLLCDNDAKFGPSTMVILSALATEYSRLVSIAPNQLLLGLCRRMQTSAAAVQDPGILAMLRISADCENIPEEVSDMVVNISQGAGRHIQRRCEQFLSLCRRKEDLVHIVNSSKSLTLPDFLEALQKYSGNNAKQHTSPEANSAQSSPTPPGTTTPATLNAKLRYTAYDTPQAIPSLRTRRVSSSQGSVAGSRSDVGATTRLSEPSTRAVTARDLAPAASSRDLETIALESTKSKTNDIDYLSGRVDLIAFDSPFGVEYTEEAVDAEPELEFETIWTSMNDLRTERGWCDASMDTVIRRLQGLEGHRLQVISVDVPPFIGDLKIVIKAQEGGEYGVLRLKESEEDSCLWRLGSNSEDLRGRVKALL